MGTSVKFTAGTGVRRFELDDGQRIVVGRSKDADLYVNSPRLSRRHCAVALSQRGVVVEDLDSSNGTFVNGQRVQQALLRPGDIIQVGGIAIRVEFDPAVTSELDLRCERCNQLVSMARCDEGQVFELGRHFLCPDCATILRNQDLSQAERELVEVLEEEGFAVEGKSPLSGGIVPVFNARRKDLDTAVAVKALPLVAGISPKKVARFQSEARAAAKVRHPSVIEVYDIRQTPRALYIVMEHVDGELLLEQIERRGPLGRQPALKVGLLVARALKTAHEQGIVHRDLKPGGILVTAEGVPKVADFGLAKDIWALTGHVTGPEETLGTVRYMPPEQVKNARQADHRADIYSLGATLFHVLTGAPPYGTVNELELMSRVIGGDLPQFDPTQADLWPPLARVIARCMKADPAERYQTAGELEYAIGQCVTELMGVGGFTGDPELLLAMPKAPAKPQDWDESTWQSIPSPKPGGVSGLFEGQELVEYLQLVAHNQKTGLLTIHSQELSGYLAVKAGRLRAALTNRGHRGGEAAMALMSLPSGHFEFGPELPRAFENELDQDLKGLILQVVKGRPR